MQPRSCGHGLLKEWQTQNANMNAAPLPALSHAAAAFADVLQAGAGSATLSMAYAATQFGNACLRAMRGDEGVVECAYVASTLTELPFFASPVRLGTSGIAGGGAIEGGRMCTPLSEAGPVCLLAAKVLRP
jgi:hypothetical protein